MKRKIIACILSLCLLAGLFPAASFAAESAKWDGTVADAFAGGTGTKEDPYQIANGAQLALLSEQADKSEMTKGKFYILTKDIDLGGKPWTPIGTYRWAYCTFEGNFDGRGHSVTNLSVDAEVTYADTDETYAGLFGYVNLGTIQNLSVSGTVQSTRSAHPTVGGVAGFIGGTSIDLDTNTRSGSLISNCSFSGSVMVQAEGGDERDDRATPYAGGIVGLIGSDSAVLDCRNAGTVTCESSHVVYAGGIAGQSGLLIAGCTNSGDVNGISARETALSGGWGCENYTGGIVGRVYGYYDSSSVTSCCSIGRVTAQGGAVCAGGVVGSTSITTGYNDCATVESCYSNGAVTGSSPLSAAVGGVVGYSWNSGAAIVILNCYSAGPVTGGEGAQVGGVIGLLNGFNDSNRLEACYAAGPVSGGTDAKTGGVIGECKASGRATKLTDCFYLRQETEDFELEGCGKYSVWVDGLDDLLPLSAEDFGKQANFDGWDWDVWKMAEGLDSQVTARPVLVNPDESDKSVPVTGVTLDQTALTLVIGETAKLNATVLPEDATDKTILWGTSDSAVAVVDENGTVTAVKEGTAQIAAAAGDRGAVCKVTVVPARTGAFTEADGILSVPVLSGSDGSALLAAYDGDGRFLGVTLAQLTAEKETTASLTLPEGTETVRLFVTDKDMRPLLPAISPEQ